MEEALWKQVEEGELEQVDRSDWAAPIVVVKKKDGEIRICADFKRTINPHLQEKTFPLPTPDEVFSTLANGESFSKLDLMQERTSKWKWKKAVSHSSQSIPTWGCSATDDCPLG